MRAYELHKCIMCYDAPCGKVCPKLEPDRIIRSAHLENMTQVAKALREDDPCALCAAPCREKCPVQLDIPALLRALKEDCAELEPVPEGVESDLSCDICGVRLENPFVLSSSVVGSNYEMCARAFEMGWAGVSFKTICLMNIHEASPRYAALKSWDNTFYGFKNIEQLSDHSLEENMECFEKLKKNYPDKVIIASIMGRNEDEWEYLARRVDMAGADVIELNFSCPNMEEQGTGSDVGQVPELVEKYTAAARRGTKKPVLAKMTPNIADMCVPAEAAVRGGADGISAINTVKSIVNVNLDTLSSEPPVRGQSTVGGYSGQAVKPIALRFISDMRNDSALSGVHLSGMGGVENWHDAVEFILLGAGSIQITTAVMEHGYRIIDDLKSGLRDYMAQRNYKHISEFIGIAADAVVDKDRIERDTISYPKFNIKKCLGCGRCYLSCRDGGHQALSFDSDRRRPMLNATKCVGCHLCMMVCPTKAIIPSSKRVKVQKEDEWIFG